jgi:hypothetical protein
MDSDKIFARLISKKGCHPKYTNNLYNLIVMNETTQFTEFSSGRNRQLSKEDT